MTLTAKLPGWASLPRSWPLAGSLGTGGDRAVLGTGGARAVPRDRAVPRTGGDGAVPGGDARSHTAGGTAELPWGCPHRPCDISLQRAPLAAL